MAPATQDVAIRVVSIILGVIALILIAIAGSWISQPFPICIIIGFVFSILLVAFLIAGIMSEAIIAQFDVFFHNFCGGLLLITGCFFSVEVDKERSNGGSTYGLLIAGTIFGFLQGAVLLYINHSTALGTKMLSCFCGLITFLCILLSSGHNGSGPATEAFFYSTVVCFSISLILLFVFDVLGIQHNVLSVFDMIFHILAAILIIITSIVWIILVAVANSGETVAATWVAGVFGLIWSVILAIIAFGSYRGGGGGGSGGGGSGQPTKA